MAWLPPVEVEDQFRGSEKREWFDQVHGVVLAHFETVVCEGKKPTKESLQEFAVDLMEMLGGSAVHAYEHAIAGKVGPRQIFLSSEGPPVFNPESARCEYS